MKKCFFIIFNIIFIICKFYSEIPQNRIINKNTSIIYEIIDDERVKQTVTIDGVQYSEDLYYAYFEQGMRVDIPCPSYLGTYKDSILFIRGTGASYRELILYQKKQDVIIRNNYENSISITCYPIDFEKYVFIYDSNPIIVKKVDNHIYFSKIKLYIKNDISKIEIFSDEIVISFSDNVKNMIIPGDFSEKENGDYYENFTY